MRFLTRPAFLSLWLVFVVHAFALAGPGWAQEAGQPDAPPAPAAERPPENGADFMRGYPPKPTRRVTKANWFIGPFNRWGLQHVREITATTEISRGDGPVAEFETEYRPLLELGVENLEGDTVTIRQWLRDSYTDGLLVLHNGRIATEVYMNGMTDRTHHNLFSVSKSFAGNLAGILAHRGQLDLDAAVGAYVPELKGGAYGDATVQHLLDMTVGIEFVENYNDVTSDIFRHAQATNATTNPQQLTLYGVLPSYPKKGDHGDAFHYVTADTDALGWVMQRATGRHLAELLETEIWSKLGAERDAYVIVDLNGAPWLGGGLNITLRDGARFGQMMLQNGFFNGRQIVPAEWVETLRSDDVVPTGENLPLDIGYKNKWWIYHDLNGFAARGVSGQRIVVLPEDNTVIVKFSSWPQLDQYHPDGEQYDVRAYRAIAEYLTESG